MREWANSGRTVDAAVLNALAAAADGFPFMMQLAGFHTWDQSPDQSAVSAEDTARGIALASQELRERIVKVTYDGLSTDNKAFPQAMLQDEETSSVRNVAQRLDKTNPYATRCKNRLLGQGVIEEASDGLRFQLPLMREYAASMEI